ncbi:hypothetical protein [Mycobacteroides chelonae]|uniref:hypothetical protein n=1 Tax=Mycobacteroides chelonae TaxID=1774 RepID=UPI000994033B|nr:hypothetical protein [Mycobacteroides chelonae]
MPTQSIATHPLIDSILAEHRATWSEGDEIGWQGYRNHAQKVYTFAHHLAEPRPDGAEKIAIAAAFHDIAVFRTLDYLVQNNQALRGWLDRYGRPEWYREIALAMSLHHRARPYHGESAWLVEAIRRADWVECTAGFLHPGIPADLVRRAQRELPTKRFATQSGLRIIAHALTHPLDPMPFMRSRRAIRKI